MYGGREKLHILLQWEKTCICPSGKLFTDNTFTKACMVEGKSYTSSFSGRKLVSVPQESSSQTTHLLLGFNEIEVLL